MGMFSAKSVLLDGTQFYTLHVFKIVYISLMEHNGENTIEQMLS